MLLLMLDAVATYAMPCFFAVAAACHAICRADATLRLILIFARFSDSCLLQRYARFSLPPRAYAATPVIVGHSRCHEEKKMVVHGHQMVSQHVLSTLTSIHNNMLNA